ncbi:MAG: hypothetical protein MUO31_05710 [Thermodesulfovibrionales bacterium]|nr:hypothetical protein [Thermodesulfovibrionales bacterium]
MKLVALALQKLQDVQGFQRRQEGDVDLFQFFADLVPDLQLHVLGKEASVHGRHLLDPAGDALLDQAVQYLIKNTLIS